MIDDPTAPLGSPPSIEVGAYEVLGGDLVIVVNRHDGNLCRIVIPDICSPDPSVGNPLLVRINLGQRTCSITATEP